MIEHVYRRAADARGVDAVVVATDDTRIVAAVERFGGIARLTGPAHRTGTDRIAEIARDLPCDILINVQGDLPLVESAMITQVVEPLTADSTLRMTTVCTPITDAADYANPHVVKVVVSHAGNALYFSRAPIPYHRPAERGGNDARLPHGGQENDRTPLHDAGSPPRAIDPASRFSPTSPLAFKHIGLYGYRRDFLLEFASLGQTPLERAESLEQLRALEHGVTIRTLVTHYDSIEVDTPEDLERVRRVMPLHSAGARGERHGVAAPARG